jgi:hypothetical protein
MRPNAAWLSALQAGAEKADGASVQAALKHDQAASSFAGGAPRLQIKFG